MRCSFLPLLGSIFLMTANIAFSSPTNHNQNKEPIIPHSVPAQALAIPNYHANTRRAASHVDNGHLPHKRDLLTASNHPSSALLQRHDRIMDRLRSHTSDSPLAKRSLVGDLTFLGFRLIWDHADIIVASSLAYYHSTEYYANITALAGDDVEFRPTTIIAYGVFRLTFGIVADAVTGIANELAFDMGQFVEAFARFMLLLTAGVVLVTYRLLAWSATVAVWITMVVVDNADLPPMVTGP